MSVSTITQRFLECLDLLVDQGKVRSRRHFALSLGYHAQGISEMLAKRRDAPIDLIEKAILNFRFNPLYLFTGIGKHFSNPAEDDGLRIKSLYVVTDQNGDERIVHVPYTAQAGYAKLIDDPVHISELPSYQLPDPQFRSGTYRSFEISGASMEPTFRVNDIVIAAFIEPRYWEQAIKSDQIYIVVTGNDVFIKRLGNRIRSEQCLICCSDNPEFKSYNIPAAEIREVWKVRMKLTSHFDAPVSRINTNTISEQLEVQHKLLEHLNHQLNAVKVS
jgi:phage repressor protein C with HTH and peptisase S24 domain